MITTKQNNKSFEEVFLMFEFGLLDKCERVAALQAGDDLVYVLYLFRGHLFRVGGGRISRADRADREFYEEVKR